MAPNDAAAAPPFRKRTIRAGALLRHAAALVPRLPDIAAIWLGGRVDPALREAVMVAVAEANACTYCLWAHTTWAGLVDDGTPADEARRALAVAYGRSMGDAGGSGPDAALRQAAAAAFAPRELRDLATIARVMQLMNLSNNTVEALQARRRGQDVPDAHLPSELLSLALLVAFAPPVVALLSIGGRRAPTAVVADFRRFWSQAA